MSKNVTPEEQGRPVPIAVYLNNFSDKYKLAAVLQYCFNPFSIKIVLILTKSSNPNSYIGLNQQNCAVEL